MHAGDTTGRAETPAREAQPRGTRALLGRLRGTRAEPDAKSLDRYVTGFPSIQNAIDAIPGWVSAMPPGTGLSAGEAFLIADTLI